MTTVDDLCRSYLDLKYHFDPAAASGAGLVAQDSRLGTFDVETVRAQLAALRALIGAAEELEVDDLQDEIDRTALLGELRGIGFRWEHEQPHVRNPGYWLNHLFQAHYAVLSRGSRKNRNGSAVLERLESVPAFLETARRTIDEPPSVFVDQALIMLGGGGQLLVQIVAQTGQEEPALRDRLQAAGEKALEALTRFGTALRDEIEPSPTRSRSRSAKSSSPAVFTTSTHSLPAHPSSGDMASTFRRRPRSSCGRSRPRWGERRGARWWTASGTMLQEGDMLEVYRGELERAHRFVIEHGLVTSPTRPVDVVATPEFLASLVPFAAYELPPIFLDGQHGRFYVTRPDTSLPPEAYEQQLRGHCRHAIAAMVVHEAYPGHHLQLVTAQSSARSFAAISGRWAWSRAGRSTASSSWRRRATTGPSASGSSGWRIRSC